MTTNQEKISYIKKNGNVVISVVACFVIFFAFSAFAIDFAYVLATRAKLQSATDATALMAAPYYINSGSTPTPQTYFAQHKTNVLRHANIRDIKIKEGAKAVMIETECNAPVFFLSALGVHYVKIQARSSAQVVPEEMAIGVFYPPYHYMFKFASLVVNKPGHDFSLKKNSNAHRIEVYVGFDKDKWILVPRKSANGNTYYYDLSDAGVSAANYLKIINVHYISTYPAPYLRISDVTATNPVTLIKNSTFKNL